MLVYDADRSDHEREAMPSETVSATVKKIKQS